MLSVSEDSKKRLFLQMLAASLVLHVAFTLFPALLALIGLLPALSAADEMDITEIELTSIPVAATAPAPERPQQAQPESPPETPAATKTPDVAPPAAPDAAAVDSQPKAKPEPPAAPEPDPTEQATGELYADPMALAGKVAKVADSNANVRLFIFADVIRNHPLGPRVGSLLKRTPQWNDFFGTTDIDPIRDVDRVLIAGPQLRNSSQVVAVVQHHLPPAAIDAAFEQLVQRKGEWIDRKARLARALADRAQRIFAAPNSAVVVVAPPQMEAQLRDLGKQMRFPQAGDDVALTAYVVTPHRVTRGTGIELPKSIKWVRLDLRPSADGGGVLKILAQDEDAEQAKTNAEFLQMMIDQVASVDLRRGGGLGAFASMLLGSSKVRMLEQARFVAKKKQIEGTIVATRAQLMNLADLLDAFLPPVAAGSGAPRNGTLPPSASAPSSSSSERQPEVPGNVEEAAPEPSATAVPLDPSTPEQQAPAPAND